MNARPIRRRPTGALAGALLLMGFLGAGCTSDPVVDPTIKTEEGKKPEESVSTKGRLARGAKKKEAATVQRGKAGAD